MCIFCLLTSCQDGLGYLALATFSNILLGFLSIVSDAPAIKAKLYIQELDAALNTLHHIILCFLLIRNSHGLGLCSESFPDGDHKYLSLLLILQVFVRTL